MKLYNVCWFCYTYLINPYERLSLCVIAKTALAVAVTPLLTYTQTPTTPTTLTTTKKGTTPMDISNLNYDYENEWEDDEPLTAEEQAAADRAYYRQQEQEAYAEFLMAPYCFD